MLTQEQIVAKLEELQALQQGAMQQARQNEEQQQLLLRQQSDLVLRLQNLQGQIDALTMVLDGEPEGKEEPDAVEKGNEQGDHLGEHTSGEGVGSVPEAGGGNSPEHRP